MLSLFSLRLIVPPISLYLSRLIPIFFSVSLLLFSHLSHFHSSLYASLMSSSLYFTHYSLSLLIYLSPSLLLPIFITPSFLLISYFTLHLLFSNISLFLYLTLLSLYSFTYISLFFTLLILLTSLSLPLTLIFLPISSLCFFFSPPPRYNRILLIQNQWQQCLIKTMITFRSMATQGYYSVILS